MDPSSPEAQAILRHYNVPYDEIISYQSHHQVGKYLLLASITAMLWDHITTLPDEIRYIWQAKNRWTIATIVFSFNRYISPLGFIFRFIQFLLQTPDRPVCIINRVTAYLCIVSFACVEIVLMLRVWVMYGKSKQIGLFLGAVFTIALGASFIVPWKQPTTVTGVIPPLPTSLVLCARFSPTAYFWLLIIASSLDTIIFVLFCVRVYLAWKDSMTTPILNTLFTQGAIYYVVIICNFAISIPATMHKELSVPIMDPNLVIVISCIACSRLILSLRGLYYSRMVVSPTSLGSPINGEYTSPTIRVSIPYPPSSGSATTLNTSMLAIRDQGEDDWIYVRSGDAGIELENPVQEGRDSTGLPSSTTERRAMV